MGDKNKNNRILLAGGAVLVVVAYLVSNSYYQKIMKDAGVGEEPGRMRDYQFEMIVDSPNSAFWQAVYKSAQNTADNHNVLLELKGTNWDAEYDKIDFMNMSIAARVDGIILEYNGEAGLEEKINEAVANGIPVVTVMSDAPHSQRQSFVGVSDYQLGVGYGEQVANYMDEVGTKGNVLVLMKRNLDDMNQSQIITQIRNTAMEKAEDPDQIEVNGQNLLSAGTFDSEEAIWDILQQGTIPDILVCMDAESTESARQAVIDYNLTDKVKIIGYYTSEKIMKGVIKGLIPVTCSIDTEQLGRYSVEALTEYLEEGRVNSYYTVDMEFVTTETAEKMERSEESGEEDSMEEPVSGE